jgi:hypothetical protein
MILKRGLSKSLIMARSRKLPEKADIEGLTKEALSNDEVLQSHIEKLSGDSRSARQISASVLSAVAIEKPEVIEQNLSPIFDALNRPERQTRWECLNMLARFADKHQSECESVIEQAESALFDEQSGILRFSAFDFLCKVGKCSAKASDKVWPLIDEAVQCYHGDVEFNDMLVSLLDFSEGRISAHVKEGLVELFEFDAKTATGNLQAKAVAIIANCKPKKKTIAKKTTKKKG